VSAKPLAAGWSMSGGIHHTHQSGGICPVCKKKGGDKSDI
jgi:hypothetical protein